MLAKMDFNPVLVALLVTLVCGLFQGSHADHLCLNQAGVCQYTTTACTNGYYTTGLCDGPVNRKCCIKSNADDPCIYQGGVCQYTTTACTNGYYKSGLCGGPVDRKCCLQTAGTCTGVTIVSRSEWGARAPKSISTMSTPVSLVFIHHTAGPSCSSQLTCSSILKAIQNYHMDTKGWNDIGYNWLVGGDGKIYEGRGWDAVGAHTEGYNSRSVAISFIGTFTSSSPTPEALQAAQNLISCGIQQGKINSTYSLYGHRQASGASTECPGDSLYAIIQGWPHWKSGTAP